MTSVNPPPFDPATLSEDWNAVLKHAKEMQVAIGRFTGNLQIAVNDDHAHAEFAKDVAFCADQLNDAGDSILVLAENISKDVEPLAKLLAAEKSEDAARDLAKSLAAAQQSVIETFGTSVLEIAASSPPIKGGGAPEREQEREQLSPAAQGIADGFERLLDGKKDSRMSYGKIPPNR